MCFHHCFHARTICELTNVEVAMVSVCFCFLICSLLFPGNIRAAEVEVTENSPVSNNSTSEEITTVESVVDDGNFIRISQISSKLKHNSPITLELRCAKLAVIGLEVVVWTESQNAVPVFRRKINCDVLEKTVYQTVFLKLPRYLAYKPGYFNRHSVHIDKAVIRAWMVNLVKFNANRSQMSIYDDVTIKDEIEVNISHPFDLPVRPSNTCPSWWTSVESQLPYRPQCPYEEEILPAITFPVALSGFRTGVHRKLKNYQSSTLRLLRNQLVEKPKFTFVIWLYINDYCPYGGAYCTILQHITWDDRYATPQIHLNSKGQVYLELVLENGTVVELLTHENETLPKGQWIRLVLACHPRQCNLTAHFGSNWLSIFTKTVNFSDEDILYFDDTVGLLVFGGTEIEPSFQGYIGSATLYRRKVLTLDKIPVPSKHHAMFELGLNLREQRCQIYIQQVNYVIYQARTLLDFLVARRSCRNNADDIFKPPNQSSSNPKCEVFNAPRSSHYKYVYSLVRRWVLDGKSFPLENVGTALVKHASSILEKEGLLSMEQIVSFLKQSSCFGNHDATFMLSVILNYGLTVKSQELQSHSYLMYGALDGNRLCLLSLGNKQVFGLDGIPTDLEQAYVYFKAVADMTNHDLETHHDGDVYTELVRLTNDYEVNEITEETGDLFMWVKHQAAQGVFNAQQNLARMLYWGSKGLERDVVAALEYYRLAAETGEPSALYDYGIVLLKGHGTTKNVSLGMEMIKKAADKDYPQALNTVGWYALEMEKNSTKAAHYFHRSHKLGNKDASYNLGHMFLKGRYPNSSIDRVRAWEYLAAGALRGQYEAGILVGMYNMRGHPKAVRNVPLAVSWARYIAELNPGVGRILASGVKAYRRRNWPASLVYYLMAASTGVEVANFNLAYLCEENNEGLVAYLEKECKWRHYNLSTQRPPRDVNAYAWIKMADFHFYHGVDGKRDPQTAADLYCSAALKGDPHGLYSLGSMIEDGIPIPFATWKRLEVPVSATRNNVTLLSYIYSRCTESNDAEAYLPCTLALYRVQIQYFWNRFHLWIVSSLVIGFVVMMFMTAQTLYAHLRKSQTQVDTV